MQMSVAVTVQICDLTHPPVMMPPTADNIGVPQSSVAGPAAMIALASVGSMGSQPRLMGPTGQLRKEGGAASESLHVIVTRQVAVLLQISVAVTVQVCDLIHPPVTTPPIAEIAGTPQLSVAGPAAVIAFAAVGGLGVQPRMTGPVGQLVKTGSCVSKLQVNVTKQVAVLLQISVAVTVQVCDCTHPPVMMPPTAEIAGTPQSSVAAPAAAMALAAVGSAGLHPKRTGPTGQLENAGFCVSEFQVNVTRQVAMLLQSSVAVTVQVCDCTQPLPEMTPPMAVTTGTPQLSVA